MKNKLIILSLLFSILGTSCGARKVQKSETKEETKVEQTSTEVKTEVATENTKIVDSSECEEIEITPIDSTKEMVVNGKTYLNVKIKHSKKKTNIVVETEKKVDLKEEKAVKTEVNHRKNEVNKEVKKESWFSWWWLLIVLIVAYLSYRWYSNLKNDAIDYLDQL